ncbi:hypothetical protein COX08_02300 [Candidatus Beckwithbacteria bacterium CG23_combo_of_CG06-09_8_20_14_all_34_8]|uniref:DUF4258 domain-containing protein n=1 Tax=Candidatus Beckwithbacteria bacterium CG23_combo_of_CG06-09_8_20_14_all_34_8 TaxID=1974497 RepID=A0A2H0B6C0_9BACT|nr:MAG: hypothetical protein COX08_02300 [Candidatus Beckwithbacteria bacterium CG23_combo_of_CG06-09_8_20_14_all_34_8]
MEYKGLIFTNHILQRMNERGIDFRDVYWAWAKPDEFVSAQTSGAYKYFRNKNGKKIAVVAKKNDQSKWVVLTCWQKEIVDWRTNNKKTKLSLWKNLWKMIGGN